MNAVRFMVRLVAAAAVVAACNLAAGVKSEPVAPGEAYFSSRRNRLLHIGWSTVGLTIGILIVAQ